MTIQPHRSFFNRPSVVTCVPCGRRSRSLGGLKASTLYLVEGRAGVAEGHLVYQRLLQLGGAVLLCQAEQRPLTEAARDAEDLGPSAYAWTWNVYREDDGAEIDSEMNPAGSWLVNRFETEEGTRWAIQRPWSDDGPDEGRAYDDEISAIADAVAEMVSSALRGDEQG